jgi:hypothetical protein
MQLALNVSPIRYSYGVNYADCVRLLQFRYRILDLKFLSLSLPDKKENLRVMQANNLVLTLSS